MDVAAQDLGHDGGVHHPQRLDAMHAELRIHDRHLVIAHPAGAAGVLNGCRRVADMNSDVCIGDTTQTWRQFLAAERIERLLPHNLARDAQAVAQRAKVLRP